MASIAGRVYAVTGGASGMGLAIALRLAKSNAKAVCIADFNSANFETVEKQIKDLNANTEVLTTKVDVSKSNSVDAWIGDIVTKFGALDGAVNCAGVPQTVGVRQKPNLLEETDETWERTMGVNLNGVFFSTRAEVKAMCSLAASPRSIVNIASMAAFQNGADCYAYGASKKGVVGLSTSIATDVAPFGIRVNSVSPSLTVTPMLSGFFGGMNDEQIEGVKKALNLTTMQADDIAEVALWLLTDEARNVSGAHIPVGGTPP